MNKEKEIFRASHESLETLGQCLEMIENSEDGLVFKYESPLLEERLERLTYDASILYPIPPRFALSDLMPAMRRFRGLGKTNAIVRHDISESAALLLFHSLLYGSYDLKSIEPSEDGLWIKLKENWL